MRNSPLSRLRRSALVAAALVVCTAASTFAAEPEVLSRVPGDAYGLMVINNVRTFSNKLSNAATRLNIPIPPDLVGYATRNLGITKGFDANSSAAVVLLKPSAERQAEGYFTGPPPAVMLLPTSDAKAMLEPFQPQEADKAGISQVTLPQDPSEKGFVATVDNKWIAFAQSKEDLAAYLARTDSFAAKASPGVKKVFEANDLVVWGNVPRLTTGADKMLDDWQTEISGMLDLANMANNQDAVGSALQKQGVNMVFAFARQFIKDADATMATVRMTDSGATFGMVGDFKADSTIGKFMASQAAGKPVTLQGLPAAGGFLAAGAMRWDSASMLQIVDNFSDALLSNETVAKDPRAADLKKSMELNKQLLALTTGANFVFLDPPAGGQGGYFNGVLLVDTTDPAKFKDLQVQFLQSSLAQQSMNADIKQTVTTSPDAVTIKGVKLTKVTIKFALRDETAEKPINQANRFALDAMTRLYGPDGLTTYLGTVGQRAVVIYGSDAGTLESAVAAAQGNTDAMSASPLIAPMKDQLVANPVTVMYLPITRWVTLAQSILMPGAGQGEAPSPAIQNAPPVVVSAGVTGSMMTAEVHVPIATISGTQEAVQRIRRAEQGGAPGGAPLP